MYKNVFWWHKFKILPDFVQLNLNVMFNIISQPYFNLKMINKQTYKALFFKTIDLVTLC